MVKNCCNTIYPKEKEEIYKEYFNNYSFLLSDFQKYAIESIVTKNHILVTAHTGSGKTLPAEFAIEYFTKQNKKVIYTSPIKCLSNQKFYEFTKKYPNISFGIITGDIKINPEAQVLIMTTEILLNKLYENKFKKTQLNFEINKKEEIDLKKNSYSCLNNFDINIDDDLSCIIFDEIHYINDKDRGKIWEESIIMSPQNIQLIMLSATIDKPDIFAKWIENRYENDDKIVYLSGTNHRIVPLTHYSFITCNNRLFKILKDKVLEDELKKTINKPIELKNSKEKFLENNFDNVKKSLKIFEKKNIIVKRSFALNQLLHYLVENNMLPAICFIFSRKNVEITASEITTNLLEFDSKIPYIIKRECEQIIRKLPNYIEYLELPEYIKIVSLLEKGIAIHHAGISPILREMVELCFSKGYVKLLIATETFSVGINMPTKSVIFTDVCKFDGNGLRMLYPHEYTQMAGRAGRRGIDTVGNVFQLTNLFKNLETQDYRMMMTGNPEKLVSKFKISYSLILHLIFIEKYDFLDFVKKGMINTDITNQINIIDDLIKNINEDLEKLKTTINNFKVPLDILQLYLKLRKDKSTVINKKKKEIEKQIENIDNNYKIINYELDFVTNYNNKINELESLNEDYNHINSYFKTNIDKIVNILKEKEFIYFYDNIYQLSKKGFISCMIKEIPSVIFANYIENNLLINFTALELVGILSCYTNIIIPDGIKNLIPYSKNTKIENFIRIIDKDIDNLIQLESKKIVNTGIDYKIQYDMIDYFMTWCEITNIGECKLFLQKIQKEKEVFLGDFIKGLLKVNNIIMEFEKVYEYLGNVEQIHILKQVPEITLKFIVSNQSLYV